MTAHAPIAHRPTALNLTCAGCHDQYLREHADPLHVEGPPDLTDVATHATGWYLTVLVVVAAALLVAIYGVTRA